MLLTCGDDARCDLSCGGDGSCAGALLNCGDKACSATCSGAGVAFGGVNCGDSCDCVNGC
jgi:hypothetical protein